MALLSVWSEVQMTCV